jgi:hypothetical protein
MADPKEGLPVVGYAREWEGDESDEGAMLFCAHADERDSNPHWFALTDHAAATSLIAELQRELADVKRERDKARTIVGEWLKENSPGGWIDNLRVELAARSVGDGEKKNG